MRCFKNDKIQGVHLELTNILVDASKMTNLQGVDFNNKSTNNLKFRKDQIKLLELCLRQFYFV